MQISGKLAGEIFFFHDADDFLIGAERECGPACSSLKGKIRRSRSLGHKVGKKSPINAFVFILAIPNRREPVSGHSPRRR